MRLTTQHQCISTANQAMRPGSEGDRAYPCPDANSLKRLAKRVNPGASPLFAGNRLWPGRNSTAETTERRLAMHSLASPLKIKIHE